MGGNSTVIVQHLPSHGIFKTNIHTADGNIGQIGEKIGGPFSKDGMIGSQFDAAKGGIAGTVEKAVDGPSQKKSGDSFADEKIPGMGGAKK